MATKTGFGRMIDDYKNLRTIPAMLGMVFFVATIYQFGGISEVHVQWFDYTLSQQHALFVSLGVLVLAFASSETKAFEYYSKTEQGIIVLAVALMILHNYSDQVYDLVYSSEPWTAVGAAAFVLIGYAVATQ